MEFPITLELRDRDKYYDGLLATLDIDFASCADLERPEVTFHIANISDFQVEVGLSELLLELGGRCVRRVGRSHDLSFYRHFESLPKELRCKQPDQNHKNDNHGKRMV